MNPWRWLVRASTSNAAATSPAAEDRLLRGRTYAIPFDHVWQASLALAGGALRGWRMLESDDLEGYIRAEARSLVFRSTADVVIQIGLDADGQTRVDARAMNRSGRADLGASRRHLLRFFRKLDSRLAGVRLSIPRGVPS